MSDFRIGHGYDVHRFASGRRLVLGGVEILSEYGLLGHSDADVLLHAIIDAIIGALGLGDIGKIFPDTSKEYEDISSLILLTEARKMIKNSGYTIGNIDATLILQSPKISPYREEMINKISSTLCTEKSRVNIKATTEEGLGFTGCLEGAAAHAVVLLVKE